MLLPCSEEGLVRHQEIRQNLVMGWSSDVNSSSLIHAQSRSGSPLASLRLVIKAAWPSTLWFAMDVFLAQLHLLQSTEAGFRCCNQGLL